MNRITTPGFLLSARYYLIPIVLTLGLMIGASTVPSAATGPEDETARGEIATTETESTANANQEEEELLFDGWEAPPVALFISGRQNGYIEPCGCTGLDNQKCCLMRRHTFYKQLLEAGWSVVGIDAGNQVRRYGRQANLKIAATFEALGT
ncbi:MAG: hypothetical protein ACR2NP_03470, partial [Pirellulaceae bacterium]